MALGIVILFKIVELQQRSVADELGNGMVNIGHCYLSFLNVFHKRFRFFEIFCEFIGGLIIGVAIRNFDTL